MNPLTRTAAFIAPAEVPEIAAIFSDFSSTNRSTTPPVKPPWEPPPCKARSIRTSSRGSSDCPADSSVILASSFSQAPHGSACDGTNLHDRDIPARGYAASHPRERWHYRPQIQFCAAPHNNRNKFLLSLV